MRCVVGSMSSAKKASSLAASQIHTYIPIVFAGQVFTQYSSLALSLSLSSQFLSESFLMIG